MQIGRPTRGRLSEERMFIVKNLREDKWLVKNLTGDGYYWSRSFDEATQFISKEEAQQYICSKGYWISHFSLVIKVLDDKSTDFDRLMNEILELKGIVRDIKDRVQCLEED